MPGSFSEADTPPASPNAPSAPLRSSSISRPTVRVGIAMPMISTPEKKYQVRADPVLLTCFDPKDKELYDLWAPKH